jgi:hypothetical protein
MRSMERLRNLSTASSLVLTGLAGILLTIVAMVGLLLTSPETLGPRGVTLWFILLAGALGCLLTLAFYAGKRYFRFHTTPQLRWRYSLRQGFLVSSLTVVLLALSSLGQLTLRDGLLLVSLVLLFELYVRLRLA